MASEEIKVVQDVLLDRLCDLMSYEGSTLKRVDVVKMLGVSQSTFNRWKLRQCQPRGLDRVNLEKVVLKLERQIEKEGRDQNVEQATGEVW